MLHQILEGFSTPKPQKVILWRNVSSSKKVTLFVALFCWYIERMRRRILPMAMEQTNARPKKEAIWYQNSLTSRGPEGELGLVRRVEIIMAWAGGRLAVIDWLMAAAPGQRITFFGPNSGTQCPPPQIPLPDHPLFATFTFTSLSLSSFLLLLYLSLSSLDPILACNKNTTPSPIMIIPP